MPPYIYTCTSRIYIHMHARTYMYIGICLHIHVYIAVLRYAVTERQHSETYWRNIAENFILRNEELTGEKMEIEENVAALEQVNINTLFQQWCDIFDI